MPLILPGSPPSGDLIVAGTTPTGPVWRCPFCPATYGKGQSKEITRHMETAHVDDIGAAAEEHENEPLRQIDKEQVDWLRREAARKRDTSVKGVR